MRVILGRGSRRIHLLTGVYLSGLSFVMAVIALTDGPRVQYLPDLNVSLVTLGLLAGIALAVAARLERSRVLAVLVPLGIIATLASALYSVTLTAGPPGICSFTTSTGVFHWCGALLTRFGDLPAYIRYISSRTLDGV